MVKIIGWIVSVIGVVVSVVNAVEYMKISQEINAWYYYRSQLETYRTSLYLGLFITAVGIVILLATYLKSKKN